MKFFWNTPCPNKNEKLNNETEPDRPIPGQRKMGWPTRIWPKVEQKGDVQEKMAEKKKVTFKKPIRKTFRPKKRKLKNRIKKKSRKNALTKRMVACSCKKQKTCQCSKTANSSYKVYACDDEVCKPCDDVMINNQTVKDHSCCLHCPHSHKSPVCKDCRIVCASCPNTNTANDSNSTTKYSNSTCNSSNEDKSKYNSNVNGSNEDRSKYDSNINSSNSEQNNSNSTSNSLNQAKNNCNSSLNSSYQTIKRNNATLKSSNRAKNTYKSCCKSGNRVKNKYNATYKSSRSSHVSKCKSSKKYQRVKVANISQCSERPSKQPIAGPSGLQSGSCNAGKDVPPKGVITFRLAFWDESLGEMPKAIADHFICRLQKN